jgi:hypothetical protein
MAVAAAVVAAIAAAGSLIMMLLDDTSERIEANGTRIDALATIAKAENYGAAAQFLKQMFPDDPDVSAAVQLVEEGVTALNARNDPAAAERRFNEARDGLKGGCDEYEQDPQRYSEIIGEFGASELTSKCGVLEYIPAGASTGWRG